MCRSGASQFGTVHDAWDDCVKFAPCLVISMGAKALYTLGYVVIGISMDSFRKSA
jgi:hypothetical protein